MDDQEQVTKKEILDLFNEICNSHKTLLCRGFYVSEDKQYLYKMVGFKTDNPTLEVYRDHIFTSGPIFTIGRAFINSRLVHEEFKFFKGLLLNWREQMDKHYEVFVVPFLYNPENIKAPEGFLSKVEINNGK